MSTFSERFGFAEIDEAVQLSSADSNLRTALWNCIYLSLSQDPFSSNESYIAMSCIDTMWAEHFHKPLDERPEWPKSQAIVKSTILGGPVNEMYEAVEFFAQSVDGLQRAVETVMPFDMYNRFNRALEANRSGYRFVGKVLAQVSDPQELEAISVAATSTDVLQGARHHLRTALTLFSDREHPDYANAVKEAISAVEAVATSMVEGKDTLGKALDQIGRERNIHKSLLNGWKSLYGHTSDAPGVRHGAKDALPDVDQDLARCYIVMSSAMVSYLTALQAHDL